ncbi:hypothetical protein B9G98_02298 [Wickerhamiella sorbophila]|uniref:Uncharacterized protein n=1 Tax=Wickerhamiella sorbophila TaxID=45607 RepID=A0A2T0FI55_9ASCO|nr:hypothetical protein B9G98_02298 [Wickerhamiella sorbophila]PRT54678.1 hypothetical protein B9G98_02298 [Wickerhamiella sorbophila]
MSLAINESFPAISPAAVAVGALYSHATSFILNRPVLGAAFQKARASSSLGQAVRSDETASAAIALTSSSLVSLSQSYAVSALLKLANVTTYKAATIVGTLLFAVNSGPALVNGLFVNKQNLDAIAAHAAVSLLDTVGLSLVLTWWSGAETPLLQ